MLVATTTLTSRQTILEGREKAIFGLTSSEKSELFTLRLASKREAHRMAIGQSEGLYNLGNPQTTSSLFDFVNSGTTDFVPEKESLSVYLSDAKNLYQQGCDHTLLEIAMFRILSSCSYNDIKPYIASLELEYDNEEDNETSIFVNFKQEFIAGVWLNVITNGNYFDRDEDFILNCVKRSLRNDVASKSLHVIVN